ncbi:MAG: hypothetical protein WCE58_08385 [Gallionella sp.]
MTSEISDSSVDKIHKVIVKGKYLAAIENYVSTLAFGQPFLFKTNLEFEVLLEAIVKLHSRLLSRNNVVGILLEKCFEFENQHPDRTGLLSDPNNLDLHKSLVHSLKTFLESLPRKYTLRIGFPSFPAWGSATYEISSTIRIVIGEQLSTDKNSLAQLFKEPQKASLRMEPHLTSYIEFSASGYSDWSPNSQATSVCLSLAKQCAFILTTHGILRSGFAQSKAQATLTDENECVTKTIDLPDSIASCFGNLLPNDEKLLVYDGNAGLLDPGKQATTNEERSIAFRNVLYDATRFFGVKNNPDIESIAVAIEWYQDSIFADNQTFSYVAACIGLEALFGSDSYLENMSKRLADRYAYLLGKSRKEREQMTTDYTEVLKLRGRLVHSKAARLSGEDVHLLYKAQTMLLNAIWHELYATYKTIRI